MPCILESVHDTNVLESNVNGFQIKNESFPKHVHNIQHFMFLFNLSVIGVPIALKRGRSFFRWICHFMYSTLPIPPVGWKTQLRRFPKNVFPRHQTFSIAVNTSVISENARSSLTIDDIFIKKKLQTGFRLFLSDFMNIVC